MKGRRHHWRRARDDRRRRARLVLQAIDQHQLNLNPPTGVETVDIETTVERNHEVIGHALARFISHFNDADEQARLALAVLREIGALQHDFGVKHGIEPERIRELTISSLDDIATHTADRLEAISAARKAVSETMQ